MFHERGRNQGIDAQPDTCKDQFESFFKMKVDGDDKMFFIYFELTVQVKGNKGDHMQGTLATVAYSMAHVIGDGIGDLWTSRVRFLELEQVRTRY